MMFVTGYYYSFVIIINCIIVNYLKIAPSGEVIKILYYTSEPKNFTRDSSPAPTEAPYEISVTDLQCLRH